ncbi:MAG: DUF305 domain-containing protein [Caulobacteraceae bacterium]|nr:MAG: DUF305 domain-containing protein [Caulobacteraceae bacterium]
MNSTAPRPSRASSRGRRRRHLAVVAALAGVAIAVAGCSGQDPTEPSETSGVESTVDSNHNDADTQFAQMMTIHHEGAIEMSDAVAERASTAAVRELASRISAAQGPEIEQMEAWLEAWGEDAPADADMMGMEHGGMEMGGMDQDGAMNALESATGGEVDRVFLELMIGHHRGAVEMAQQEVAAGLNPQAIALARDIIDAQEMEIAEMQQMLKNATP